MVCKNEKYLVAICWDKKNIYAFVLEPTEYQYHLVRAVNNLPVIFRKTIILFAFEQIEREKIASILKVSINAVRFLIDISGLLLRIYIADWIRLHSNDPKLNEIFANWPWLEYAELAKLRRNLVFLK